MMEEKWNTSAVQNDSRWVTGLRSIPGMDPSADIRDDPPKAVLFKNVNVFNGLDDKLIADVNVLVEGGVIKTISQDPIETGGDGIVIDGGDRTLMPGLIDAHVHLAIAANFGQIESDFTAGDLHLNAAVAARHTFLDGFTSVRDVGGPVFGLKRAIDSGKFLGPRIYPSGSFIGQTSGHADFRSRNDPNPTLYGEDFSNFSRFGISTVADGRDAVLAAARQNLMQGASQIKIMAGGGGSSKYDPIDTTQMTEDEMRAAVEAAEDWGTYVSAHIFTSRAIKRFIKAGGKSVEHAFFMDEDTIASCRENGVFVVPQMWGMSPELFNNPNVPKSKHEGIKAMQERYKNFCPWLLKHNVKVAFASDLLGPIPDGIKSRRYELYWRTQAFGSTFEVLKHLTSAAGELLALSGPRNPYPGKLGVVEEGALGDLILVDGNPLDDITVIGAKNKWFTDTEAPQPIKTLRVIMKDGHIYKNTL
jgi:imidazolonepropionase-like amidohydrolase